MAWALSVMVIPAVTFSPDKNRELSASSGLKSVGIAFL
jgi:hypothetical protein